MKASDLIVRCLENEGVEYAFGVPGEEMLDLLDSISRSGIRFISTRHEQGAAFMADGYGRLTGRAGLCLSTLGPGAMNLATGLADANLDHAPVVAITGQVGLRVAHKEFHQYIDTVQAYHPITKWNTRLDTPAIIPEVVRNAFRIAEEEKPGATHIELPEDVAELEADGEPMGRNGYHIPAPRQEAIDRALDLIAGSRSPIILSGNGTIRARASRELRMFAEAGNIPVSSTFMGKGAFSARSPLWAGTIGLQARDHIACGFERADLVIAIGYDIIEYPPIRWNPDRDKKILHIDATPAVTDAEYMPAAQVIGDIATSLAMLAGRVDRKDDIGYFRSLRDAMQAELEEFAHFSGSPVPPQKIVVDMRRVLGDEDILLSDVGAHKLWIARLYPAYEPNTVLISNGLAAMGFALPAAIAAKLVHPERRVLAAVGDGGFLMNVQELETAQRLRTPIVVLIFNDNGYGLIKWKQMGRYNKEFGVDFGNPDFVKLAEAFGARGYRPADSTELRPMLKEAFEQDVCSIIDVRVDYSENFRLTERLGQMVCPL